MDNVNNDVLVNNEPETTTENTPVIKLSPKDKYMADGKMSVWEIILTVRYFLPLLTTVGFALAMIFKPKAGDFIDTLSMIFAFIGWIAVITVSPIKILKFIWGSVVTCFSIARSFIPIYGVADLVAGVVGFGIGVTFSAAVLAFIPAVFSIPKFFKN